MAYNVTPSVVTGDTWTAGKHNTYVRDNFKAVPPDTFTAAGQLIYGTGDVNMFANLELGTPGQYLAPNAGLTAPEWKNRSIIGCSLYANLATSFPATTWTKINFYTEDYDTNGFHSTTDYDSVLIPFDGVYQLSGFVTWVPNNGAPPISIRRGPDSHPIADWNAYGYGGAGTISGRYNFCYVDRFAQNDDVYIEIYHRNPPNTWNVSGARYFVTYLGAST